MTRKKSPRLLKTLEQRFQALQNKARDLPETGRRELDPAIDELARAIAGLRRELDSIPTEARTSGAPKAPPGPTPTPCPPDREPILRSMFNAIPELIVIVDRDFNVVMCNWHEHDFVPEAERRGRPTCYRVFLHRDRPCEPCHVLEVFDSGQPQTTQRFNPVDGRVREVSAFPIHDESGQVILVVEHVRDITERHRAEQARKESEERFQAVFDTALDSIFIKDRSLKYIQVNQAMEKLFHRPASSMIGKTDEELYGPVAAARIRAVDELVLKGQVVKKAHTRPILGKPTTFHVVKVPLHDDTGQVIGLCGIARDITDITQAEAALKESEARFRSLFEYAPDAFHLMDSQGNFLDVNLAFEKLTGYSREEIIGKNLPLLGEKQKSIIIAQIARTINDQPERGLELNVTTKDGREIVLECRGLPLRFKDQNLVLVISRDITARKRAEEALRESEERFKFLFEYAPDVYLLIDLQGNFLDVNRAAEKLTGYRQEELIGQNYQSLPFLDDRENAMVAELLSQSVYGQTVGPVDLTLTTKEGRRVIIEAKGLPLEIKGQNLLLAIVRDITDRKRAEEAMRVSESRFRTLFEHSPVGISITDTQGRFLRTNQALQHIIGFSAEELQGLDFLTITAPEDLALCTRSLKELLAGQIQHYSLEKRYIHKDGGIIWGHLTVTPLRDARGEIHNLLATVIDITARKEAEEALRESEERYRTLFETSPDAIFLMDLEMNLLMGNRQLLQLFGFDRFEEARTQNAWKYIVPEDQGLVRGIIQDLLATGQVQIFEANMLRRDKTVFPSLTSLALVHDAGGNPQAIIGVARDIRKIKKAEEDLRQSEQKFRLMAENIQDLFWIATADLRELVYLSPAFEQIWGRPTTDLFESPRLFIKAVHPDDRERVRSAMIAASTRGTSWSHEYRIVRSDGAVRWIEDRGFPVRDEQDRVILFTGVATDITGRRVLEEQLLQAQKMEAVGRLAGGVAHDFNNLLMAITGYGELLRSKIHPGDPLAEYLDHILQAGERAVGLTQQLLAFSRQQIIHPQVINVQRVLLDLEPMLRRLLGEDLELEIRCEAGPLPVRADLGHLSQIIMNLAVNARDAMPRGGRLTLTAEAVDFLAGRDTRFGVTPPGAYVQLMARDTGIGMDKATQDRIFEPFFTTKEPGKGTGLGLSTVYGIVKQSGGYLALDSRPGAGSTFVIYLPRLDAVPEPVKAKAPITADFQGEETVLLVEDEDVLRLLLAKFLRLYGYTVLEARHGGEALLLCERHQGPIHLMVTDVVMPQMSGRELADRLTPLRPDMQVLYMSGYTEDALVQHGVAEGSVLFLQKPFKPIDLVSRVRGVLNIP